MIYRIMALLMGYPLAAMFSANVSMNVALTVWSSWWTYMVIGFWWTITAIALPFLVIGIAMAVGGALALLAYIAIWVAEFVYVSYGKIRDWWSR